MDTEKDQPDSASASATPEPERLTQVIALDGPAGSGKSTVARRVAAALGWRFVDTGAGYRAAALAALRSGVPLTDQAAVVAEVSRHAIRLGTSADEPCVTLDGEDVSAEIRSPEVTAAVSSVSSIPAVRSRLIGLQREAMGLDGAVVDGRDIATVVAPHAAVKVYLDARPEIRAARRSAEQTAAPVPADGQVQALVSRDERDNVTTPLTAAEGAVHLETSDLSLDEVVEAVIALAREAGLVADVAPHGKHAPSNAARPTPAQGEPKANSPGEPPTSKPARSARWVRATGKRKPWLIAASRPFGQVLFRSVFRLRVVGAHHVPRTGPVLLAGNHTGFLDGPLAYAVSPRSATFIAKSELFVGPLARALGWLGQIPVHRGRPDRTALRCGLAVLRDGGALGVFPEGTRGAGRLDTVSDGVAYLALRSGAPVVPLAVLGTMEAMPKGARLPRWRAPVGLVFGAPFKVDVDGDPRARRTIRAAGEQIRLQLVAHLDAAAHELEATSRRNDTGAANPAPDVGRSA